MAPSALVQALMQREQDLRAESPWLAGGSSLAKTSYVQPQEGFTGGNLVAALMPGLVGGLMRGYGNSQINDQLVTDQSDLANMIKNPNGVTPPEWAGRYSPYILADALAQAEEAKAQKQAAAEKMFELRSQLPKQMEIPGPNGTKTNIIIDPYAYAMGRQGEQIAQAGQGMAAQDAPSMAALSGPGVTVLGTSSPLMDKKPNVIESKIFDKQADAEKAVQAFDAVSMTLSRLPQDEGYLGALARNVDAAWRPNSEAAQLQRDLKGAIATALKPMFPGALSDQEREYMQRVLGDQTGVSVPTLMGIIERAKARTVGAVDAARQQAVGAGFPMRIPQMQVTPQATQQPKTMPPIGNMSKEEYLRTYGGQ